MRVFDFPTNVCVCNVRDEREKLGNQREQFHYRYKTSPREMRDARCREKSLDRKLRLPVVVTLASRFFRNRSFSRNEADIALSTLSVFAASLFPLLSGAMCRKSYTRDARLWFIRKTDDAY